MSVGDEDVTNDILELVTLLMKRIEIQDITINLLKEVVFDQPNEVDVLEEPIKWH